MASKSMLEFGLKIFLKTKISLRLNLTREKTSDYYLMKTFVSKMHNKKINY